MVIPNVNLSTAEQLDHYFQQIDRIILSRQDPVSGLFPASTDVNTHGDYTDAWVRDNVYTIQSVWGLALAYRAAGCDNGRAYLLEQSVVKMMRGLLIAMMRQADKVERFKRSRNPNDALHAKYDTKTGDTVVADHEWGHLQLDATGFYMLSLAQMTKSGLRIVYTLDEVNFIQNLVYYLGRAYRTPDFGIWERGNKINDGRAELNASSLGMVKAALEAMRGLNLFGNDPYQESIIHVISDEVAQTRIALNALLPRESNSKEVDAALLSVIAYPAFAVEDAELIDKTRARIQAKLAGRYGCKRFLLDGHQTVLEDTSRLHYESHELKKFENIESEWPLFFTYLFIEGLFNGDYVTATHYRNQLQALTVEKDGIQLLPELYYVEQDNVAAEKAEPGSQSRVPNDNVPLIWAQSLFYLGCLIDDGLLSIDAIDPLHRHSRLGRKHRVEVGIALLADQQETCDRLTALGYPSDTLEKLTDVSVKESRELSRIYSYIGLNKKLQLSGRPIRRMRSLMNSQLYRVRNELVVFLPQFQNQTAFYINLDNHLLVEQLTAELHYLTRHWDQSGKPLIVLSVNSLMLGAEDHQALLNLLEQAKNAEVDGVQVILGSLNELIHGTGRETIREMHDFSFHAMENLSKTAIEDYLPFSKSELKPVNQWSESLLRPIQDPALLVKTMLDSKNLYQHIDTLTILTERHGLEFTVELTNIKQSVTVKRLIEEVYRKACDLRLWGVIRRASGLLGKYYDRLDVAVQEVVIRQKQVMVGRSHNSSMTISEILTSREIYELMQTSCENNVREVQMNQELLTLIGILIKTKPELFDGIVTIRTGHLLLLCVREYARETGLEEDEAFEVFSELSPYAVQTRLQDLLANYKKSVTTLDAVEALHYVKQDSDLTFVNFSETDNPEKPATITDWLEWRKHNGTILGMTQDFYEKLWNMLDRCKAVVIGDRYNSRSRLDTEYIHGAMTGGERSFVLLVDGLLNEIYAPEYRYLTIEAIMAMAAFLEVNQDLYFDDSLVIDMIIERALRLSWLAEHADTEQAFNEDNSAAWEAFYNSPPHHVANSINLALENLLLDSDQMHIRAPAQKTSVELGQSLSL